MAGSERRAIRDLAALPRAGAHRRRVWIAGLLTVIPLPFLGLGRLWGWVLLAALLGIGLGWVPLFGGLGFELALAAALFAAIMGADLGRALARSYQALPGRPGWPARTLLRSTLSAAGLAVAVILVPGLVCALRGLWRPTCDWSFGIAAFLAMPVITAALAGAVGHLVGVLVGPRRVLAAILAQLPAVVVALLALWRFYAAPPVFTYNAILGYFPGNLYDENVQLAAPLLWSRLEQLAWVIAAGALLATRFDVPTFRARLVAPRPQGRRTAPLLVALVALAGGVTLRLHGGALGYAIDASDIAAALGGRLETAHFVIYYAQTPEIEADLPLIAADHEFRYAQVVAEIGTAPPGKLHSFYFANRDQKAALMGARDVEMAKPWRHEIYLDHRPFPHPSLRHEIAHSVASAFGDPWFGIAARRVLGLPLLASPGLIEGLAVALDWPGGYDRPNPHESVRAMQQLGALPPLDSLFGLGFFAVSSQRGYTTAGSFLRFLLDTYGASKLRAVYANGGDFEAAYGVSRARLEGEWKAMIATLDVPPTAAGAAAERFRGTSLFARTCPHAIAAQREQAFAALVAGHQQAAVALMGNVCAQAPGEPRYLLELGQLLVDGNAFEAAVAESLWLRIATDPGVTSSLRATAIEQLARRYGARRDFATVRALVAAGVALPLDPPERRTLEGMAFALAHAGPARVPLLEYFFPSATSLDGLTNARGAVLTEPAIGLGHYLLGLQLANRGEWAAAAVQLEQGLAAGLPSAAFVKNAARRLAVCAYRAHDRARLIGAITVLGGAGMASGDRLLAKDWQERLAADDAAEQ